MVRRSSFVVRRALALGTLPGMLLAMLLGAALLTLAYQIPAHHDVDVGGYDAAYVQGFYDPERSSEGPARPYLVGSDGSVRWTHAVSYLLFPQAGLPGTITLRLRGWRSSGPPPHLTLLLNGQTPLAEFTTSGDWEQRTLNINSGLLKANDVFIELRADAARLDDGRTVGVLLDHASYTVGPGQVTPYPAQLAYSALAAGLLWVLYRTTGDGGLKTEKRGLGQRGAWFVGAWFLILGCFIVLYRLQPPIYPYPLRGLLPGIDLLLVAALVVQMWRRPVIRAWVAARPALFDVLALVSIGVWTVAVLMAGQGHLTLARPGVENDFRVFATRDTLTRVFQADGFYNLGYPLLLWLIRPLTQDNPFLAARLISAVSGAVLLGAGYWLAKQTGDRRLETEDGNHASSRWIALLVLLMLMFSPFVVEYALYVGSDIPFAAFVTLAVTLLIAGTKDEGQRTKGTRSFRTFVLAAGFAAGSAFLVRHLGLVLLAWALLHCVLARPRTTDGGPRTENQPRDTLLPRSPVPGLRSPVFRLPSSVLPFALGFLIAAAPQLIANTWQTGNPIYNQQAKNVWLAVYGNGDWGRWDEVPNTIGLREVLLRDPGRFLTNWSNNLRAFVGTGAEDTSEFGRAIQLHLLAWPANWLAVCYFGFWILDFGLSQSNRKSKIENRKLGISLLILSALYVVAVCMAFALPRFFLPLVPIYALAAAWGCWTAFDRWGRAWSNGTYGLACAGFLVLVALLWPGWSVGTRYVLDGQPSDEVTMARLVLDTLRPGEQVLVCIPADVPLGKYSAIAHRATLCPTDTGDAVATRAADLAALEQARTSRSAAYLLWSDVPREARATPPLPDSALLGRAGVYSLYRLKN